ncbi:cyclically-permuted mutarotase family protein [Fodinibius sediminis]|uniref:Cyclically-permuted mutarotase family protein n=2 Tax=Fodinibius sediminis TaxID=1214077 RepID=A0A521EQ78_9BACT|nr:cyclically-permuted mutarotase family protein [Fodinibius sediminis]
MKNLIQYVILLLVVTMALYYNAIAQDSSADTSKNIIHWHSLSDYPDSNGVAGAFVGTHNNVLLMGGGANFPSAMPGKGGEKVFYNTIHILQQDSASYNWHTSPGLTLPDSLAYGATVSTENGIILIGGTDGKTVSSKVYRLQWEPDSKSIDIENLPSLPKPLAFMDVGFIDNTIYVAGGQHSMNDPEATKIFWKLDISKEEDLQWEELHPWPGPSRILPIAAAQYKGDTPYFFLFSGRNLNADGSMNILNDAYRYNIKEQKWNVLGDVGHNLPDSSRSVMGASALPSGDSHILVFGGDSGDALMERLELITQMDSLRNQMQVLPSSRQQDIKQQIEAFELKLTDNLTQENPFSKNVLSYHTITDSWDNVGQLPNPPPVTTTAVKWNDQIILPSGETRPGVRTPEVWQGTIDSRTPQFGWVNYSALGLYAIILIGMGFYFSHREDATDDYFLAGNRIPWWAAGISIYATQLSAITFISTPVLAYADNWIVFIAYFTIFLMAPVVIYFYLPFFRRLNVTSAYEYLEKRFHLAVRLFGSVSFILFQLGRMSVVVFLPALTLTAILDMNIYAAIILMGVLAIIYTTLGGIEAVIWSDVLQVFILVSGIIYSLYFIINYVGGLEIVYTTALEHDKLQLFDFSFSFTSLATWSIFLGSFALQFGPYTTDQAVIQRYLTTRDEKSAADSIWTNGIISIPTGFLFFALGTCLYVFYKLNPDFLSVGMQNDQVFPLFIGQQLPMGYAGLLIAGIFSASMSSLDSSMHSISTVATVDFYERFVPASTENARLNLARWVTVLTGVLGTLIACLLASFPIQSLYFFFQEIIGLLSSALAGIFILGIFTKRTHGTGALIGAIISLIVLYIVKFHTPIHFYIYPLIGIPVCVFSGYFISYLFPDHGKKLEGLTYRTLVTKRDEN